MYQGINKEGNNPMLTNAISLAGLIYSFMVSAYPLSTHEFTGRKTDEIEARYRDIALDIATVSIDDPMFSNDPEKTAMLLTSFSGFESGGFAEKIDNNKGTGDSGRAKCIMQLHAPFSNNLMTRLDCIRGALLAFKASLAMCSNGSLATRLSGYTAGKCVANEPAARTRVERALRWLHSAKNRTEQFEYRPLYLLPS